MGEVYLAEDLNLGRRVAVKFLSAEKVADPEARKRFIHEARSQALVSHTNVTAFHEVGEEGDRVFIVMEYIEGQKLSDFTKTEKLSLPEILDLAVQVGEGLQAAHEKGVMHRDINPANILVTSKGVIKITDFGLAKWKGASTITQTGLQMGTDSYMSPEQLEGRKADSRTDIFSFGVVLYELICACRPFEGNNREALFYEILYSQPQPLARYSNKATENLQRIVSKCLAKKPEERYQSLADLVADLKSERKSIESGVHILSKPKKWLPLLVPAGIGLAVLLFLIFKPFSIEIGLNKESAAAENSLAVIGFENLPDPEDKDHTGEMLTNLLITSLSQLKGWEVISRQRLYDIQADMGKPNEKKITPSLASKIAQRAGVKTMLLGTVLQCQPKLAVTSQLIEVKSGRILSSQLLTGYSASRIFPFADSLAILVRNNLHVSPSAASDTKPVAEVTTSSPEAYRAYIEGIELTSKWDDKRAQAAMEKALELDSNFAMAYLWLSNKPVVTGDVAGSKKALQKAYELSDRVTKREQSQIRAYHALTIENDPVKASGIFEKLLQHYPHDQDSYYRLHQIYMWLGDYEKSTRTMFAGLVSDSLDKVLLNDLAYNYAGYNRRKEALETADKNIKMAPAEFNPYDSKAEIYLSFGELDSAAFWNQKAITLRATSPTLEKLAYDALLRRDYARSEKYIGQYDHTDKVQKASADYDFSLILMHQGKLKQAQKRLLDNLSSHLVQNLQLQVQQDLNKLIHLAYMVGDYSVMLDYAQKLAAYPNPYWLESMSGREMLAWAYLKNGQEQACFKIMDGLKKDDRGNATISKRRRDFYLACFAYEKGQYATATEAFKKIRQIELPNSIPNLIYAECLLKTGDLGEAINELQRLIQWYPINQFNIRMNGFSYAPDLWPMAPVLAHYWLGVAYERMGEKDKAEKEYETFLDIWKNADPGIAEVEDAKQRLVQLKKG